MCYNNIENECPFVFECPCYQNYREILLNHHGIPAATPILDMLNLFIM